MSRDLAAAYLRWALVRAALARGWWLATALYLVLDARLTPSQLLLVGAFQGLVVVVAEVPAGVLADTVSRRLSLVLAHVVTGTGMALTAGVTSFPLLVVAQGLWGLGRALSSGADVAWITDELDDPERIDRVLVAQARRELLGTVVGLAVAAGAAWATRREAVLAGAGAVMIALAAPVARWPERGSAPVAVGRRLRHARATLRQGAALARGDRVVGVALAATFLVHGGGEGFGRLLERRVLALGLPAAADPIAWFALLALASAAAGALVLRAVDARIDRERADAGAFAGGCVAGAVGLVAFALAPGAGWAAAGALLVSGIAFPVARVAATVMVNRRTASAVRATAHSMLSQAENGGELVLGLALAAVAAAAGATPALLVSAGLLAVAGGILGRLARCRRRGVSPGCRG